jgi:RNA polymerase sigma-70 factor (ECF subfamily)
MEHNCRKYFERISEFIDGELDDSLCRTIQAHLGNCPECRSCIESLKKTIALCKNTPKEDPDPEFHQQVMKALRALLDSE